MTQNIYLVCEYSRSHFRIGLAICMTNCTHKCDEYHKKIAELRERYVRSNNRVPPAGEARGDGGDSSAATEQRAPNRTYQTG